MNHQNKSQRKPRQPCVFNVKKEADGGVIVLYGEIYENLWYPDIEDGIISASRVVKALNELKDEKHITVRLNTPGGSAFDSIAIYSALKEHPATVTVKVDGLAASGGSIIAMAGDEVIMAESSMLMIHNPWSYAVGDANEMRKVADDMDKLKAVMLKAYMDKSSMDESELSDLLDAETWLSADEAVSYGFADKVIDDDAKASISYDLSKYKNVPNVLMKNQKEEAELEIKNMEDFKAAYPQIYDAAKQSAYDEGVQAERERIKALDALGAKIQADLLNDLKYTTPKNAVEAAHMALTTGKLVNDTYMANALKDANDGVNKVAGTGVEMEDNEDKAVLARVSEIAAGRLKK